MKKQVVFIFLFFCATSNAQSNMSVRQTSSPQNNFGSQIIINQVDGQPIKQKYIGVVGSPYLFESFKLGNFVFTDGTKMNMISTKIDICSNEVHLINEKKQEVFLYSKQVKEIIYYDTIDLVNIVAHKIVAGLPAIEDMTDKNFYELLSDGKTKLVKSIQKKVNIKKDDLTGETTKDFELYSDLYVVKDGTIKRLKKDKKYLLELLNDKADKVATFLNNNRLSFKDIASVTAVFNYYNSLQ